MSAEEQEFDSRIVVHSVGNVSHIVPGWAASEGIHVEGNQMFRLLGWHKCPNYSNDIIRLFALRCKKLLVSVRVLTVVINYRPITDASSVSVRMIDVATKQRFYFTMKCHRGSGD